LVTKSIDRFTENGLVTKDGESFDFDVIIMATGTLSLARHWKDHFKNDLRSDQDHSLKIDLRSDQAMPGSLVRQPSPTVLSGSLVRQPCPTALPGSLARQPCPAALSKYYKLNNRPACSMHAFHDEVVFSLSFNPNPMKNLIL
jgi:hypothetical protein